MMHLIMDFKCTNQELMRGEDTLRQWLLDAVAQISMTVIDGPFITCYPDGDGRDQGLTGVVILAESLISVHTWPEKPHVSLDIFSCKDFNADETLAFVTRTFGIVGRPQIILLQRGIDMKTGDPVPLKFLYFVI